MSGEPCGTDPAPVKHWGKPETSSRPALQTGCDCPLRSQHEFPSTGDHPWIPVGYDSKFFNAAYRRHPSECGGQGPPCPQTARCAAPTRIRRLWRIPARGKGGSAGREYPWHGHLKRSAALNTRNLHCTATPFASSGSRHRFSTSRKTQRIDHNNQRAGRHADGGNQRRHQSCHCERQCNGVVNHGPREILADHAQGLP